VGPQSDELVAVNEAKMSTRIKVEIFDQVYPIEGELEEGYIRRVAAYVDEKMRLIADVARTVDTQKVAVLTALAIADELHRLREERGEREEILKEQAERCLTLVERALRKTE
jgi:cell division protein ZapA